MRGEGEEEEEEEDGYEVPPELEDVLEMLLSALRDKDTVVRWSGAKGCVVSVSLQPIAVIADLDGIYI